jgi:hypothetical protein
MKEPSVKTYAGERITFAFEPGNRNLDYPDAASVQLPASFVVTLERPIGTQHDVLAPLQHFHRELGRGLITTGDDEALAPMLAAIAERAGMRRFSIEAAEAVDLREFINHARRQQQHPRFDDLPVFQRDGKAPISSPSPGDLRLVQLDGFVTA